jgi:hypothetical protein
LTEDNARISRDGGSDQGNLTLSYSLHAGSKIVAQGIAAFERDS